MPLTSEPQLAAHPDPMEALIQRSGAQEYKPGLMGEFPGQMSYLRLPGGVPIVFCWCQPGWLDYAKVEVEKPYKGPGFWMGKYLVTQRQWVAVMGKEANRSHFPEDKQTPAGEYPVDRVSWEDGQDFRRKAREKVGIGLWLPGEAEWEYACRAGSMGDFSVGAGNALNSQLANFNGNYPDGKGRDSFKWRYLETTRPVGSHPSNLFGLHDMHGQLWEWCFDAYDSSYRVLRGGSWFIGGGLYASSGYRGWDEAGDRHDSIGLRLCPSPSELEQEAGGPLRSRATERREGRPE